MMSMVLRVWLYGSSAGTGEGIWFSTKCIVLVLLTTEEGLLMNVLSWRPPRVSSDSFCTTTLVPL